MKKLLVLVMVFVLNGCANLMGYNFEPKSVEAATTLIKYETDEFEGDSWLKSEAVANMSHPSAIYHYRAYFDKNNSFKFIQVYVNLRLSDWYFIDDAVIKSENTQLNEVDREVMASNAVHEDVAITISKDTLERMATKDTLVKLKGKRGEYIFSVSQIMSEAFYTELLKRI